MEAAQIAVQSHAARLACPYVYCNAGAGESTTDAVYSGLNLIANNGRLLVASQWQSTVQCVDFNPRWVEYVRMCESDFPNLAPCILPTSLCVSTTTASDGTFAGLEAHPFVPQTELKLSSHCETILQLQTAALKKRFEHTHAKRLVIGLSGGLDSTLALLVCCRMVEACGLPPSTILGVTMPGFGTSKRTRTNVDILAEALGIELREIPIGPGVELHFRDIGHDPEIKDVTYENAQARARTYLLMDLANQENGLLVGTGDLSEIALGWSTYNGDHMSMYSVNCDVPKLLVRHCVQWVAQQSPTRLAQALQDICDTPVSPELLPGEQHTESIVGSYTLHDFFLYYFFKYGCDREELAALAAQLHGDVAAEVRDQTLAIFCRRFIQQQFKRSASPDGPKVGTVALSPRGDWHMPSDAALLM
jgi:NAD+ synthase (glutamine-hydrolysing)